MNVKFLPYRKKVGSLELSNYYVDENGNVNPRQNHLGNEYNHFEISKCVPNPMFGKKDEFLADGYVDKGEFLTDGGHSIDARFFVREHTCYMIARFTDILNEDGPTLEFIGDRPCDLDDSEAVDFMKLVKDGFKEIERQTTSEEGDMEF